MTDAPADHAPEIALTCAGRVRGKRVATPGGAGVIAWLGVPYAAPPVGARRFRPPAPPEPWTGVRDALDFRAAAPQAYVDSPVAETAVKKYGTDEDCLYLNVWSPAADDARRPVLVWIHGGAFVMGTSATYRGDRLAARGDVVVVSINYRLGLLGFADLGGALGDDDLATNLGLRDQLAALAWVRANIAAFGGDPDRVTVAGESAGASSVALLLTVPAARPLIAGAIAQSGNPMLAIDRATAIEQARAHLDVLGVTDAAALRALPAARLVAAQQEVALRRGPGLAIRPVLDGELLPADAAALVAAPTHPVPMIVGTNRDEATLFTLLRLLPTDWPTLEPLVRARAGARADAILAAYPRDEAGALALAGDLVFTIPALHLAERHAARAPTWMYRWDWPTPILGGRLGAMHALEIFFLWMDLDLRGVQLLLGGPPTPALRALAARLQDAWLAFVRTGTPGAPEAPGAAWPRFAPPARATRIFDLDDRVVDDPAGPRRVAWDGLAALV